MLKELEEIITKQKVLTQKLNKNKCNDIHSILSQKDLIDNYLELEVKRSLLSYLISKKVN